MKLLCSRSSLPCSSGCSPAAGSRYSLLTLGLAVVEGAGCLVLGAQPPSAGKAEGAAQVGLVSPPGAGLARLEPIVRVVPRRALPCRSEEAQQKQQPHGCVRSVRGLLQVIIKCVRNDTVTVEYTRKLNAINNRVAHSNGTIAHK